MMMSANHSRNVLRLKMNKFTTSSNKRLVPLQIMNNQTQIVKAKRVKMKLVSSTRMKRLSKNWMTLEIQMGKKSTRTSKKT